MIQAKAKQEIRFWRRLIERWETARGEQAPERMYEALAAAERRLEIAVGGDGCERITGSFH